MIDWTCACGDSTLALMDIEAFLRVSSQFRLGELVTEQPHPETIGLAEQCRSDLEGALQRFHRVDQLAMEGLGKCSEELPCLVEDLRDTLQTGGRIYLAGCGATGRLALSLETFARDSWLPPGQQDRVISFMAGGDAALIRSIESFEDYPEYGSRQLQELGLSRNDLLLAITEGGETPWVIGACQEAARCSDRNPWFLFCNPPGLLKRLAERSREVLENERVRPLFLDIGPMALAGSTRLQATTAQMLVVGAALAEALGNGLARDHLDRFGERLAGMDYRLLVPFIEAEAQAYQDGNQVLYQTDHYGITVLTDTTERSPTFSLDPFENRHLPDEPSSWCYLSLPGAEDAPGAWETLLGRAPRTLDWEAFRHRASREILMGYDISRHASVWRRDRRPGVRQLPYHVHGKDQRLEFAGHGLDLQSAGESVLVRNLLLKCCLNAQSTLVMGRLGLFESNLMTKVRPSNYKLIDRAARHAQFHHRQKTGTELGYEAAVRQVFASL